LEGKEVLALKDESDERLLFEVSESFNGTESDNKEEENDDARSEDEKRELFLSTARKESRRGKGLYERKAFVKDEEENFFSESSDVRSKKSHKNESSQSKNARKHKHGHPSMPARCSIQPLPYASAAVSVNPKLPRGVCRSRRYHLDNLFFTAFFKNPPVFTRKDFAAQMMRDRTEVRLN
jgi:hypothetical protein